MKMTVITKIRQTEMESNIDYNAVNKSIGKHRELNWNVNSLDNSTKTLSLRKKMNMNMGASQEWAKKISEDQDQKDFGIQQDLFGYLLNIQSDHGKLWNKCTWDQEWDIRWMQCRGIDHQGNGPTRDVLNLDQFIWKYRHSFHPQSI